MTPLEQPLHRHADLRVIVFDAGLYRETSLLQREVFQTGDLLIRPGFFAHDGRGETGASYFRLPVSARAGRRYLEQFGWTPRTGHLSRDALQSLKAGQVSGDEVMVDMRTRPLEPMRSRSWFDRAANALASPEPPPSSMLAEELGMAPHTFSRRFSRIAGFGPDRFRSEARLQRAFKWLAESDLSLAQVAAEAGFCDQSHLSRLVRRATGLTPGAIRRMIAC